RPSGPYVASTLPPAAWIVLAASAGTADLEYRMRYVCVVPCAPTGPANPAPPIRPAAAQAARSRLNCIQQSSTSSSTPLGFNLDHPTALMTLHLHVDSRLDCLRWLFGSAYPLEHGHRAGVRSRCGADGARHCTGPCRRRDVRRAVRACGRAVRGW